MGKKIKIWEGLHHMLRSSKYGWVELKKHDIQNYEITEWSLTTEI